MIRNHKLKLRAILLFIFFIGCYGIIILNLFVIQVLNSQFFSSLGSQQYRISISEYPERAPILDRHGQPLATNKACSSAFIIPYQITRHQEILDFLSAHFPDAAQRYQNQKQSHFMFIKRRLSLEEQTHIKDAHIHDIHFLTESSRFYPIPSAAALIGFTNIENSGKAGIEYTYDRELSGSPTLFSLEKDARSGYFYFEKQLHAHGFASKSIQLTIDADLQFLVDDILMQVCKEKSAQKAMALIINPDNGDLLALSSVPTSLPSDQGFNISQTKHAAIADQHEFGSIIKVFAALAALEEGVVQPDELIDCKNKTECTLFGRPITTWKPHGIISFKDVIAFSNNIGIALIAHRLGPHLLYEHYKKLGFGQKTAIPLPAEAAGFLPPPSKWSAQSLLSLSYGYEVATTLLQLAKAFCLIAHDGHTVHPRLCMSQNSQISEEPLYKKESIETIKDIMRETTEHGTGWRARMEGFDIMTKTGSAHMLEHGHYNPDKNIYTAGAILQKKSYKRVILVSIIEPACPNAFASTIAMPALRTIMQKMVIHERAI